MQHGIRYQWFLLLALNVGLVTLLLTMAADSGEKKWTAMWFALLFPAGLYVFGAYLASLSPIWLLCLHVLATCNVLITLGVAFVTLRHWEMDAIPHALGVKFMNCAPPPAVLVMPLQYIVSILSVVLSFVAGLIAELTASANNKRSCSDQPLSTLG
jgi:hypothetical protein